MWQRRVQKFDRCKLVTNLVQFLSEIEIENYEFETFNYEIDLKNHEFELKNVYVWNSS